MQAGPSIQYEVADRNTATYYGGIGLIHSLAQQCGLVESIDSNVQLLQNHFPYHESDHVLNIAYNAMAEPRTVAPESVPAVVTLGELLTDHARDGRTAKGRPASEKNRIKWRASITYLLDFFDYDRDISTITHDDAYKFWRHLQNHRIRKSKTNKKGVPFAENTVRKHIDNAKVFFNGAVRRGLIAVNPFEHLVSSTREQRERDFEVTRQATEKIIKTCPDAEWRLLGALWRYAGLRKRKSLVRLGWTSSGTKSG
jgi:hypothetical protein